MDQTNFLCSDSLKNKKDLKALEKDLKNATKVQDNLETVLQEAGEAENKAVETGQKVERVLREE